MSIREKELTVVVEDRFQGLPEVAHGGYVTGLMASALEAESVAVRLRRPVPTGRSLSLERPAGGTAELRDGEALLAAAEAGVVAIDVPPSVSALEAAAASRRFPGHHNHPVPGCLVCGTDRQAGDGLRIFPGPVAGRKLVAAPWTPEPETADSAGQVIPELVSAAFDCAQLWALIAHAPAQTRDIVVTAELELNLVRPALAEEPHVLVGWPIGREQRAWLAGAALLGADGELRAVGRQRAVLNDWGVPLGLNQTKQGDEDEHS